jgi:hypothetical protein
MGDFLPDIPQITHTIKRPIRRVALACIQCRLRKVKCDATLPNCNRCQADEKACEYQKSRRGGRPRRPVVVPLQVTINDTPALVEQQNTSNWCDLVGSTTNSHSTGTNSSGSGSVRSSTQSVADALDSASHVSGITLGGAYLTETQIDQLLSSYYAFFHVAHPCVLPRESLRSRLASQPVVTEVLLPVLLYIGSIFTHTVDSEPLAIAARQAIALIQSRPGLPSPYYLQALLLYSIAVYASNEPERGRQQIECAICGALSLGMQRAEFAVQHGQGDPILEESWRRTWWMIYITDAHIAGSTHSFPSQTGAIHITTDLPCEEQEYESGVSHQSNQVNASSSSSGTEHPFSSHIAQLRCSRIFRS